MKCFRLLLLFNFLLFAGCKKCPADREMGEEMFPMDLSKEQVLKINLQGDPASLDPHTGVDLNCRSLQKALFEGLTRISIAGKPELALAEKVSISESQTTYTFTLRDSYWSNGEKVTAAHFEKAWKRALAPNSNSLRCDLFYPIKNAKKAKKGEVSLDEIGIYAKSKNVLVVELDYPTPYFLDLVALPTFSPLYEEKSLPTVFNGPFLVKKWDYESCLTLAKNPSYWDAQNVQLNEIIFSLVQDPHTSLLLFEKGEVDWAGGPFTFLPTDSIIRLGQEKKLLTTPIAGVYWISCNTDSFPLTSSKIRKALSLSLNRKEIAEHLIGQTPFERIVPDSMYSNPAHHFKEEATLDLAITMFNDGLKELNITKSEFPPLHLSHSDVPGQKKLAEFFAEQWTKKLGIKVVLVGSEWNTFFANLKKRQYQIGGCIWYSAFNDPTYSLDFFRDIGNSYNVPQWENPQYQKFLDLAQQELNLTRREEYLKSAEEVLLKEMPIIPIYLANHQYMVHNHVKGLCILPTGVVDFKHGFIEK